MAELSPKKTVRRVVRKAANSPVPEAMSSGMNSMGPTCGHSNCGTTCNVRYVGPTSHMRDHHVVHTARGISQVWTAAIVAGLAVVLTGAIAWSSVDAQTRTSVDPNIAAIRDTVNGLNKRVVSIEEMIRKMAAQCMGSEDQAGMLQRGDRVLPGVDQGRPGEVLDLRANPGVLLPVVSCRERCVADAAQCQKASGTTAGSTDACSASLKTCLTRCAAAETTPPPTTGGTGTTTNAAVACRERCMGEASSCLKNAASTVTANLAETCTTNLKTCLSRCTQ